MPTHKLAEDLIRLVRPEETGHRLSLTSLPDLLERTAAPAEAVEAVVGGAPAAPQGEASAAALSRELGELVRQMSALREATARQTESVQDNTRATLDWVAASFRGLGGALSGSQLRGGMPGLGSALFPLATGLVRLFSRNEPAELPPLPSYSLPRGISQELAMPDGPAQALSPVHYTMAGLPRRDEPGAGNIAQIHVHVNAIDSKSFLDHRDDIARAVREAMLNMHSINDIVGEL